MMKLFGLMMILLWPFNGFAQKGSQGIASYYHTRFHGRKTASGEIFSNQKMTAASNRLKLGTMVRVTNLRNGKSVIVKINDRMSAGNGRLIDLSHRAAQELCFIDQGTCKVVVEPIEEKDAFLYIDSLGQFGIKDSF
ncbi:MAG: septal ring lytic transglycosylase RlpA family protein [Chitinophagaceae bacterium]|nr:septal ring lytic transglycosylase RlpA family protein [Chitinophagaceae bacterium]